MNCIELAHRHAVKNPDQIAIWMPGGSSGSSVSYGDLFSQAGHLQQYLVQQGVRPGQVVLLVDSLGPRLYAAVIAMLSLGCMVVLVEPWMPVHRINQVLQACKPDVFLSGYLGKVWGARAASIRRIPLHYNLLHSNRQRSLQSSLKNPAQHQDAPGLQIESLDASAPGILTFTSGTTGEPKGVVRGHGFLFDQHRVLEEALDYKKYPGPDLCIFANFTLANLASGRTTLLMPPAWKKSHLDQVSQLPATLQPETLTCGPAFLLALMRRKHVPHLKSIHVGGALTDCWILEKGFERWPEAHWTHVYGSTEAEPVALSDARVAVQKSRAAGFFQTLYLGKPVSDIRYEASQDGLWVAGPHVCPRYIGNDAANKANKRTDEAGVIWHYMGDRIAVREDGFWYNGRSNQSVEDFELEQQIYVACQSSKSFVHHTPSGAKILLGEVGPADQFLEIDQVVPLRVYRDRRHRARIDRSKSITRGAKWLVG